MNAHPNSASLQQCVHAACACIFSGGVPQHVQPRLRSPKQSHATPSHAQPRSAAAEGVRYPPPSRSLTLEPTLRSDWHYSIAVTASTSAMRQTRQCDARVSAIGYAIECGSTHAGFVLCANVSAVERTPTSTSSALSCKRHATPRHGYEQPKRKLNC